MTHPLLLSTLFLLFISVESYAQTKRADRLREELVETALRSTDSYTPKLIKWVNKDTLKYFIVGEMKFISSKNWHKFTQDISALIGIPIKETTIAKDANIHIFFGELIEYFNAYNIAYRNETIANSKFDNWSSRSSTQTSSQLSFASYCVVPSKIKNKQRGVYNIKHSFLKSLGLLGSIQNRKSMFNTSSPEYVTDLIIEDKRIIKLFYSDIIKPGMTREEIQKALENVDLEAYYKMKL